MTLTQFLRSCTVSITSIALLMGVASPTSAHESLPGNHESYLDHTVENAQDALGIENPAEELVPEQSESTLWYTSGERNSTLSLDDDGVNISPISPDTSNPLFTIKDSFSQTSFSVSEDGSTVLSGDEADYVVDAYADGSLRVHAVIESQDKNHRIPFELSLSEDEFAQIEEDGSVGFYRNFDDGEQLLTSAIDKPWAVDAIGKPVATHFELDGNTLIQVIEADSTTVYPVTADPFWVPAIIAGIRIGVHVLVKVGPRVVKYVVAPASRVTNVLRGFTTLTFRSGSNVVKLDKSAMKHILERHHPQYWNGTSKSTQTFFNPKMTVSDVRNVIHGALKNHSSSIRTLGSRTGTYTGSYSGVNYKMVVSNGRVVQFYPR